MVEAIDSVEMYVLSTEWVEKSLLEKVLFLDCRKWVFATIQPIVLRMAFQSDGMIGKCFSQKWLFLKK
jgi:hypothetical protein